MDDGLATGVRDVDAEHRVQVKLVDALLDLVARGAADEAERTLAQLRELTAAHFRSEELLMRLYAYPRLDAHEEEHAAFADRLQRIRPLAAGASAGAAEALRAARASLLTHVRSMDQDFARWCIAGAARGVKAL